MNKRRLFLAVSGVAIVSSMILSSGTALAVLTTDTTNIGKHPSYGAAYSGFWRTGLDYSLLTDGTNTFVNAPSGSGGIYFRANNNNLASFNSVGVLTLPYISVTAFATIQGLHVLTDPSTNIAVKADNTDLTNGFAGYFDGRVSAQSYFLNSDRRLKKDIKDSAYGLNELIRLRPVTYTMKEGGGGTQLGLIAQEVREVLPEAVSEDKKSGMLSLNYIELIPVLIKTVQQQQKTIEQQGAQIDRLQQAPTRSLTSLVQKGGGTAVAILLPFGFVAALRRRKKEERA